jgi:outer membrane lipoprotein-sorting protein
MRYLSKVGAIVGVALSVVGTGGTGAPLLSADEILKKCLGSYDAAKTFQGDVKFANVESTGRTWVSMRIKAENDDSGMVVRSSITIVSTGDGQAAKSMLNQQIIDDGTTLFVVYPDQKQYATGPHVPDKISGLFRQSLSKVQHAGGRLSVEVRPVNGRPTFVLTSRLADSTARILVDKATFHLQSIHVERGKPPARDVADLTVSNQVFNKPIPAENFVWKAPAGFTKAAQGGADSP